MTQIFRNLHNKIQDNKTIHDILVQDYLQIQRLNINKLVPQFCKQINGLAKYPLYKWHVWYSPAKNKWNILKLATKRSDKKFGGHTVVYCERNGEYGTDVFVVTDDKTDAKGGSGYIIMYYTPHFFSRYKERMKLELSGDALYRHYVMNNMSHEFKHDLDIDNLDEDVIYTQGFSTDGVALGYTTPCSIILFKTFITYDMLRLDQTNISKDELHLSLERYERINETAIKQHYNI